MGYSRAVNPFKRYDNNKMDGIMKSFNLQAYLLIAAVACLPACSSISESTLSSPMADATASSNPESVDLAPVEASLSNANDALASENVVLDDSVDTDVNIEYMRIKHHLVECEGYQVGHCLLIQTEGSDDWVYFYEEIEGFEFEWGTDYEILVQKQSVTPVFPTDSSLMYSLLEVLSSTQLPTDDVFSYTTRNSHDRILEIAPQEFSLLGEKTFTCNADDCNNLRSAMEQEQATVLSFQHSENPEAPLLLEAVLCADAAESFTESCL